MIAVLLAFTIGTCLWVLWSLRLENF